MWNNNSDDYGGPAGGGYLNSSGTGISPTQRGGKGLKLKGLVPISVAGIREALQPDNTLSIGHEKVEQVTVLGLITSVNMQSTVVNFKIDDMTSSPLDVKQWVDQNGDVAVVMKPLIENCYVSIMGNVRSTNGEVYLVANRVRSVVDLNELTAHLVNIIHAKLIFERGLQSNSGSDPNKSAIGNTATNSTIGGYGNDNMNGLTQQQQMVLQAISSFPDDNGCEVEHLINVTKGMRRDNLKQILSFLSEEGHIYTTIDDDHFKATSFN